MSDSVGKISLDLEIKSDLGSQIGNVSKQISKNIEATFQNGAKGIFDILQNSIEASMKSINDTVKASLNEMKSNMKSTIESILSITKSVKIPKTNTPQNQAIPKEPDVYSNAIPRAPPAQETISTPKVNIPMPKLPNTDMVRAEIENTTAVLDNINAKIEQQKAKLAQLKESYDICFNSVRKNKLEEQMLNIEGNIVKLIGTSDKLGFKLADLDAMLLALGTAGAAQAAKGVSNVTNSVTNASKSSNNAIKNLTKLDSLFRELGIGSKKTSGHVNGSNSQFKMMIRSMVTWGMMFPMVIRGIRAMATSLGQSLMTNQQFANSLGQIKTNLMVAFTPIYQAALPAINALMGSLATMTTYIASFISSIFGKTFKQSYGATQQLIDAKTAMGAYGESAKKTAKEVGSLASIDEINTLGKDKGADNEGLGGNDKIPQMVAPGLNTDQVDSDMSSLAERVKNVFATLFQPFRNAWVKDGDSVLEDVKKTVNATKDTFNKLYDVISTPPVQLFIENMARIGLSLIKLALSIYREFILPILNWFIDLLPGAANGLNPILDAVRRFIDYLASNGELLRVIISLILGVVVGFKTLIILVDVVKWISTVKETLTLLWSVLMNNPIVLIVAIIAALVVAFMSLYASSESFRNIIDGIASTIASFLAPAFEFLKEKALDIWNNALVPLGAFLADLWQTVLVPLGKIIGDVLVMAFQGLLDITKSLWNNVLEPLANFISEIFIKVIQGVIDIYNNWKPVIQGIIAVLMILWDAVLKPLAQFIISVFVNSFKVSFTIIGDIINGIRKMLGGIIDFISGIFSGNLEKAMHGIVEIIDGILSGLSIIVTAPLNAMIGLINAVISGLNKIKLPDWVPGIGGKGINIPEIPYLAKGGIIDSPTLAMVGERGKEAVVPLENNTQWMDKMGGMIANAVIGAIQFQGNTSSKDKGSDIYLQIDGTTFARLINPYQQQENSRIGKSMILKTV